MAKYGFRTCIKIEQGASAVWCGGGRFAASTLATIGLAIVLAIVSFPAHCHDLVARTESGRSVVLARVDTDVTELAITCKGHDLPFSDPVIDIEGFAELKNLKELSFYHATQIDSYGFLSACSSLERLSISFSRVKSLNFLSSLPRLVALHLEVSDDWESEHGLPFAAEPIDLSENRRLEYLAFRLCQLKRLPVFVNVPADLKYVDFAYNPLEIDDRDTAALDSLKSVEKVYIFGAKIDESVLDAYENLILEGPDPPVGDYFTE